MGICHLTCSLITKSLDKLCVVHSFKRNTPLLPPSLIFMASLPRYQKTYLLCTISLEYSATVKKTPKFPSILKSHWKSSLRLFLHFSSSINGSKLSYDFFSSWNHLHHINILCQDQKIQCTLYHICFLTRCSAKSAPATRQLKCVLTPPFLFYQFFYLCFKTTRIEHFYKTIT